MNNKSTENLLELGGSVEELTSVDVPTLDLKEIKTSDTEKLFSNRDQRSAASGNLFREESKPVPAARKLSLPPIANRRNGKDLKENSNQLTRKQSLQNEIAIENERKPLPRKVQAYGSETSSEVRSPFSDNRNKIELDTLKKEVKDRFRKHLSSNETNEETTSFISYEEKHEQEESSEHNRTPSPGAKSRNDGKRGRNNEAFVADSDDEHRVEEDQEANKDQNRSKRPDEDAEQRPKRHSKTKSKKSKSTKKSKEKRYKSSSPVIENASEHDESGDDHDAPENYDFKRVVGIWIHETSAFKFDALIREPRVRVSFYNMNDGKLLSKSNPLRNAVLNYEPTNVTFIQPILSNRCKFKESRYGTELAILCTLTVNNCLKF